MSLFRRKSEPLRCYKHKGMVSFSRALTHDECRLLRFIWDVALESGRPPDIPVNWWPFIRDDRHVRNFTEPQEPK